METTAGSAALRTLSVSEAADATGFPEASIRKLIRDGALRACMPYGHVRGARIWLGDLEAYVTGHGPGEEARDVEAG